MKLNIGKALQRTVTTMQTKSPIMLAVMAGLGVGITIYNAIKDTNVAIKKIEDAGLTDSLESGEEQLTLNNGEKLKKAIEVAAPCYANTAISAAATLGCIAGSTLIFTKQRAALTAQLASTNAILKQYAGAMKNMDPEISKKARMDVAKQNAEAKPDTKIDLGGEIIFKESALGLEFKSTWQQVTDAEYHLNRLFILRNYASMQDFMNYLGQPTEPYMEEIGWSSDQGIEDGYSWIDFDHRFSKEHGKTVCRITYPFDPRESYLAMN